MGLVGLLSPLLFIKDKVQSYSNRMLHEQLTQQIIGCAMRVHSSLGSGFQEVIYQRALAIEMNFANISFIREHEIEIYYKTHYIGKRRVDFFVEKKIMVEIKALSLLENIHLTQAMNYLEAYGLKTGLLMNFGAKSLEFKRIFNNN